MVNPTRSNKQNPFIMANNIFINNDPTLGDRQYLNPMNELDQMEKQLSERMENLQQMRAQIQLQSQQPQQSRTPVWDEIDNLISGLNDKEYDTMMNHPDFQESQQHVMEVLQSVYMSMMRPMVEGTKEGKEALDAHLALTKRLRKQISKEIDSEFNDFKEYKEHYSHMTYADYQNMKREQVSK